MQNFKEIIEKYRGKVDNLDLEIVISHLTGKSREFLLTHPEFKPEKAQILKIQRMIQKRLNGVPLAYLIGKKEFYGLEFKVDKNVLIPRPETEILVEKTLKLIKDTRNKGQETRIVDVGTGSGNIIISIVKNLANLSSVIGHQEFFAIDISQKALDIAKANAKNHKVLTKIKFLKGNLLNPLIGNFKLSPPWRDPAMAGEIGNSRILILANLPYVSHRIYKKFHAGIKFEPRDAILSENCGFLHYKKLFTQIKKIMTDDRLPITIVFEFSPEQKNRIELLAKKYFSASRIEFKKDLANKWRIGIIIP